MNRYKRLLVALNLTDLDVSTVRYAAMIGRMAQSQRVCFVHVAESLAILESLRAQHPQLVEVPEDVIEAKMRDVVKEHFHGCPNVELRYEVTDGSPIVELLRRARQHDINLAVVGKDPDNRDGAATPTKMARKAPCSVVIVPGRSEPRIGRILVPVDFSPHSKDALCTAIAVARAGEASIDCLHVYDVPPVYAKIGRTYDQFAAMMRDAALEAYKRLASTVDMSGLDVKPHFAVDDRPSKAIENAIGTLQPDLVVMGARGRTDAAAVLLGSATERVICRTSVPVLAVKKKGETVGLLAALLEI